MIIKRQSMITGVWNEMDLPVTKKQIQMYENNEGTLQDIFSNLTPDQREFIKSGILEEEWENSFKD
jgi:hypothetical protein